MCAVTVGVLALLWLAKYGLDRYMEGVMELKAGREAVGKVTRREHVVFPESQKYYINEVGMEIEIPHRAGRIEEEYRVYYRIETFKDIWEPYKSMIQEKERERLKKYGERVLTATTEEEFAQYDVGADLFLQYRWCGGADIEMMSAQLRPGPTIQKK